MFLDKRKNLALQGCRGSNDQIAKRNAAPELHRWFKLKELDICKHNPKFFSRHIGEFDSMI